MNAFKIWVHGLAVAAVSAFASALAGALGLPSVFTFDRNGVFNVLKLCSVPTILAVCLFLKQSPIPKFDCDQKP